ncbi:MAG: FAD-binding oxidoreductase [Solirubrobacteraceae bacterium]
MTQQLAPESFEQAAAWLAEAAAEGRSVHPRGSGTKLGWGAVTEPAATEISTARLDAVLEHNAGDLTAVLQAGVPLAQAQARFATAGQMLALDPPLGEGVAGADSAGATVGGVLATADSGPLRHRYGAARDLVIGMTVALSDGTLSSSGGKVIKNVAGYDLGKLFAGSFGTLGLILSVAVRLHPRPEASATALGSSGDPQTLAAAARAIAAAPLELDALDVAWRGGRGGVLARCSGAEPGRRAWRTAELMRAAGLEQMDVSDHDEALWSRQRGGQRSLSRALVRVAAAPSALGAVIAVAQACGATLVGRAALGVGDLELDPEGVERLRRGLPEQATAVVLDAPGEARPGLDPWGPTDPGAVELMRRVKERFDPAGVCNPGVFVGGI